MKLQENKRTGQKFVNLPKQLCAAMDLKAGISVSFKVIDSKTLQLRKE
ncbi:MAG: hypothetical protein U9O94_09350 [Nanoarchaeota archaeon]|nr:hypothetical protein [Nanoarchaeota archaeon]